MRKSKDRHRDTKKEPKDGEVARLKKAIRRLESDKRQLLSELATIEAAFQKNVEFLKNSTKDLSVRDLMKAANKNITLKELKETNAEAESSMEARWRCHKCDSGVLKLVIFQNLEGKQYLRACSNKKCTNRTKPKPWNDNVKGIR